MSELTKDEMQKHLAFFLAGRPEFQQTGNGLEILCESMKAEIAKLKADNEKLVALAKFGRSVINISTNRYYNNRPIQQHSLASLAEDHGLLSFVCGAFEETPLATLPEGIE